MYAQPGKWVVMYMCWGIDFASVYDFVDWIVKLFGQWVFFSICSPVTEYTRYSVPIGQAFYEWQACAVIPCDTKRIATLYLCMNNDHDKKEAEVDTITLSTYTIGVYRH